MHPSGRAYIRAYAPVRRRKYHHFLEEAVRAAGGQVFYSSGGEVAPLYLAARSPEGVVFGLVIYAFGARARVIKNRPRDEHRLQLRYGNVNVDEWRHADHPLAIDPAQVDLTLVLGVDVERELLVALDPLIYPSLPMGISIYWKETEAAEALTRGWHAWERDTITGELRPSRSPDSGVQTLVGLRPERLFDLIALEREAQLLALAPALRLAAAERIRACTSSRLDAHILADTYQLSPDDILELIAGRTRLEVAVRGGVAEHHLGKALRAEEGIVEVERLDQDGPPDYRVLLADGRRVTVECKNASPTRYKTGQAKVETQKTRASRGDPSSRYYARNAFDVVAACMYGPDREWTFRFQNTAALVEHPEYPDKIAPVQRIDNTWPASLLAAVGS